MINKGCWIGQYQYANPELQKGTGFESTNFEIEILTIADNSFSGKVQDDLSTGGTEGIGEIKGKVFDNKIEFVKQMPLMTLIVDKKGTRKTFDRKHRKIYYSGLFSEDRKSICGQWRFKFGIIWLGIFPLPVLPVKGSWTMKQKE